MRTYYKTVGMILLTAMLFAGETQNAVQAQGTKAGSSPWWTHTVARGTSSVVFPAGMGAKPSPKVAYTRNAHIKIARAARGERPATLLLTEYLPPVLSQGQQGSCAAWSTAYYNYTYCVAQRRKWSTERLADPKYQFSPAFLYNQLNEGKDAGIAVSAAFEMLAKKGCATLAEMPYNDSDISTPPDDAANTRAGRFTASETASLFSGPNDDDTEKLKTFLNDTRQPFVLVIPIFNDFPRTSVPHDTVYNLTLPATAENFHGLHAITIVGYDDNKKAFLMVNSWGKNWGDGGFLWLAEDFIQTYATDGWSVVPGGLVAREVKGMRSVGKHIRIISPTVVKPRS